MQLPDPMMAGVVIKQEVVDRGDLPGEVPDFLQGGEGEDRKKRHKKEKKKKKKHRHKKEERGGQLDLPPDSLSQDSTSRFTAIHHFTEHCFTISPYTKHTS